MNSIQAELDKAEADLATITASLEQCQKDLEEATQKRDDQFELLGKRMKYLQQKGAAGYLEILLDAQSFSDLFLRMQYVNDIMAYDKQMLDELQEIQNTISEKKTQIEEEKAAQEEIVAELDSHQKIIDGAGLQNTVRRVVFIPQDALLLVIPYFLGYDILADADCGVLGVVIRPLVVLHHFVIRIMHIVFHAQYGTACILHRDPCTGQHTRENRTGSGRFSGFGIVFRHCL